MRGTNHHQLFNLKIQAVGYQVAVEAGHSGQGEAVAVVKLFAQGGDTRNVSLSGPVLRLDLDWERSLERPGGKPTLV